MVIPLTKLLMKSVTSGPDIAFRHSIIQELTRHFAQIEKRYTLALLDLWFKKILFSKTPDEAIHRVTCKVQASIIEDQPEDSIADTQLVTMGHIRRQSGSTHISAKYNRYQGSKHLESVLEEKSWYHPLLQYKCYCTHDKQVP